MNNSDENAHTIPRYFTNSNASSEKVGSVPQLSILQKTESRLARRFYNQSNDDYLIINFPFKIGLPR